MTGGVVIDSLVEGLAPVTAFADLVRSHAHEWDAAGGYPAHLLPQMRELGLFGLCGGDLRAYALALEEMGRAWLSLVPIVNAHSSAVWTFEHHGTPEQRDRWLPLLATGARLSCLGLTEPGAGSDLQAITSSGHREGDDWILSIEKTLITHAEHADHMLVLVRSEGEDAGGARALSLFLIDREQWVVERRLPKLGTLGVETCRISAHTITVGADRLIGAVPGRGFEQIMDALEVGRLAVAAAAVGVARSALWRAVERVRERAAFGAPLSENALVRHRIAGMTTRIAAAKGLVLLAAERKNGGGRHDAETAAAKIVAAEAAMHAATTAMELGGGMGYTEELDFARHLRDAALFLAGEGANSVLEPLVGARTTAGEPDLAWI
ncbi:acyl-CoA dehydrogenase family protein [Microbacterium sp.]|uniref:acyl-CoA dehydrogenase family protein n=1 Tax=Microbacterium sp. TaxID=51671 RepID=UPI0028126503|nr:acyl-CoA dehydrogenase family protein [Microbacterium sp.]